MQAIAESVITFAFGAAGTGKTHIAAVEAVQAFEYDGYSKIILIRPAREAAGESLGYLPGTLEQKLLPYLYPVLDSLSDYWMPGRIEQMQKDGQIEFWPVAYSRGRTYTDAFVIVDEAQNLTLDQMYLVLTRIGQNAKMVVNGDWQQCDLRANEKSCRRLVESLRDRPYISHIEFDADDVVRHPVVAHVIDAKKSLDDE